MSKVRQMNCKCSDHPVTFIRKSTHSTGMMIVGGILTLGMLALDQEYWWKCTKCGRAITETL